MDYSCPRYKIIRAGLDANPAHRSPKDIANFFNLSLITIEKWGEDPEGSGSDMPAKYEIAFMEYTRDYRLLNWIANQVKYSVVAIQPHRTNGHISDELLKMDELRGHFAKKLRSALADGRINAFERAQLRGEVNRIITNCQDMLFELDLDGVQL